MIGAEVSSRLRFIAQVTLCSLYNQRDTTYTMFFIIMSALHVSGGFSAYHQELIKLYVQPWVLSRFPAVYRWCGWVGTLILTFLRYQITDQQRIGYNIPQTVLHSLMLLKMGKIVARNMSS
jgi:hypothetical protein